MGKYIPPEKMTIQQIFGEIEREYIRWNHIANNGSQDPFWPDGCNMNLVRNHIIYWYNILASKKQSAEAEQPKQTEQLSLFIEVKEDVNIQKLKPLPPEVPPNYMISNCKYSNRFKDKAVSLVWGHKGEYQA